jgi:hypothetical protein
MDLEALCGLTIVQLLEEHNRLVGDDEARKLKGWKGDKVELAKKIIELRDLDRKRRSARTIKSAAYEYLLQVDYLDHTQRPVGHSYDVILAKLREEFPDSSTTDKCLRWYAVQLNLDQAKMPWRPRRAPKRKKQDDPVPETAS